MAYGYEEGNFCGRDGCKGVIAILPLGSCTCFLGHAPCGACEASTAQCSTCGFDCADENEILDMADSLHKTVVYPEGVSAEDVLAVFEGTLGG